MPPRVAILGWGSLLWEGGSAFDKWHDDWRCDGPILNLEFSRVSASRLNALTLVIDRDNGVPNRVAWCLSLRDDPALVHADLRSREGTTVGNIGRILLANSTPSLQDQSAADIAAWARTQALDAVVWTRLSSNFESATKVPFSVDNAQAYLRIFVSEMSKVCNEAWYWLHSLSREYPPSSTGMPSIGNPIFNSASRASAKLLNSVCDSQLMRVWVLIRNVSVAVLSKIPCSRMALQS